jgi:two-component system response regulator YesN
VPGAAIDRFGGGGATMPYNILLVDDDSEFREEFCELFEDYRFLEAQNGREALDLVQKANEIDLVILDVKLPDIRGTKVLQELKRLAPELPVIILTGYSTKDVAIEALKGNADDYIEKPVDLEKAEEIIGRLLQRGGAGAAETEGAKGKIARVESFVQRNYHKKVSLEEAAALVCLSPKYLSRLFRERIGQGFNEYRLRCKIEHSIELLRNTEATVNQIAWQMGYRNAESFIRIFKKVTGRTPSDLRRTPAAETVPERPKRAKRTARASRARTRRRTGSR